MRGACAEALEMPTVQDGARQWRGLRGVTASLARMAVVTRAWSYECLEMKTNRRRPFLNGRFEETLYGIHLMD
jgi:hypothetical protein